MKHLCLLVAAIISLGSPFAVEAKKPKHFHFAQQSGQIGPVVVERYVIDAFGDVDGVISTDGWFVKFPAHQSFQLVQAIQPGDVVVVSGAIAGERVVEAWTFSKDGGTVLVRTPKVKGAKMPKHLRAASLRPMEAQGRVTHVLRGKKGEAKNVVLDSGATLRLGKHAGWVIGQQLLAGTEVFAKGIGTDNQYGRGLEVTEIALNGGPMMSIYGTVR